MSFLNFWIATPNIKLSFLRVSGSPSHYSRNLLHYLAVLRCLFPIDFVFPLFPQKLLMEFFEETIETLFSSPQIMERFSNSASEFLGSIRIVNLYLNLASTRHLFHFNWIGCSFSILDWRLSSPIEHFSSSLFSQCPSRLSSSSKTKTNQMRASSSERSMESQILWFKWSQEAHCFVSWFISTTQPLLNLKRVSGASNSPFFSSSLVAPLFHSHFTSWCFLT